MDIKKHQQIEDYIRGKLSPGEIDSLWVEFLKNPAAFEYFEVLLHLHHLNKSTEKQAYLHTNGS